MEKLRIIFLYLMFASAPMYGMVTNLLLAGAVIWPCMRGYVFKDDKVDPLFIYTAGNVITNFLSACAAKIDYFGGEKCGLWKSGERIKREKEQAAAEIEKQNLKNHCENEKQAALLEQQQQFLKREEELKKAFYAAMKQKDEEQKKIKEQLNILIVKKTVCKTYKNRIVILEKELQQNRDDEVHKKVEDLIQENTTLREENIELKAWRDNVLDVNKSLKGISSNTDSAVSAGYLPCSYSFFKKK